MSTENMPCEYDPNEMREDYIARMTLDGFKVETPLPNELMIDIDTPEQYQVFLRNFEIFRREIAASYPDWVLAERTTESRSGSPGKHIRIVLPFSVTDTERIAWQAALGSDPLRELLSMLRCKRGDVFPTMLVEKP